MGLIYDTIIVIFARASYLKVKNIFLHSQCLKQLSSQTRLSRLSVTVCHLPSLRLRLAARRQLVRTSPDNCQSCHCALRSAVLSLRLSSSTIFHPSNDNASPCCWYFEIMTLKQKDRRREVVRVSTHVAHALAATLWPPLFAIRFAAHCRIVWQYFA